MTEKTTLFFLLTYTCFFHSLAVPMNRTCVAHYNGKCVSIPETLASWEYSGKICVAWGGQLLVPIETDANFFDVVVMGVARNMKHVTSAWVAHDATNTTIPGVYLDMRVSQKILEAYFALDENPSTSKRHIVCSFEEVASAVDADLSISSEGSTSTVQCYILSNDPSDGDYYFKISANGDVLGYIIITGAELISKNDATERGWQPGFCDIQNVGISASVACTVALVSRIKFWCQGFTWCVLYIQPVIDFLPEECLSAGKNGYYFLKIRYTLKTDGVMNKCQSGSYFYPAQQSCVGILTNEDTWYNSRHNCWPRGDLVYLSATDLTDIISQTKFSAAANISFWGRDYGSVIRPPGNSDDTSVPGYQITAYKLPPSRSGRWYLNSPIVADPNDTTSHGICVYYPVLDKTPVIISTTTTPSTLLCPQIFFEGVLWGPTQGGTSDINTCPYGSSTAIWKCGTDGNWATDYPDMSNCSSYGTVFNDASTALTDGRAPNVVLKITADDIDNSTQPVMAGDITNIVDLLSSSLTYQETDWNDCNMNESINNLECIDDVRSYIQALVQLGGTSLRFPMAWLTNIEYLSLSSSFFNTMNQASFLAIQADVTGDFFYSFLAITTETENDSDITASALRHSYNMTRGSYVQLPNSSIQYGTVNNTFRAMFGTYGSFDQILGANSMWVRRGGNSSQTPMSGIINCVVVGCTIGTANESVRFGDNDTVEFALQHIFAPTQNRFTNATCVFWDTESNSWSSEGCFLEKQTEEMSICRCNHLTNIAVLVDYEGFVDPTDPFQQAVTIITIVGCSISVACLILSLVIFSAFPALWSQRNTIHRNLCLTLLIAQTTLLAGVDNTGNYAACKAVALILHYFYLSLFAWMLIEGYQVYVLTVTVFVTETYTWRLYVVGYVTPLVIVAISAACCWDGYGTDSYCWLSSSDGLIWAFLGPAAAVVTCNIVILICAFHSIHKHSQTLTSAKRAGQQRHWIKGSASLCVLLGVTWAFGFFLLNDVPSGLSMAFEIIFAVLNSLQGVFIFIFHCLMQERIRSTVSSKIRSSIKSITDSINENANVSHISRRNRQHTTDGDTTQSRNDS